MFNSVAAEYDRHRPGYPGQLIDAACGAAGLGPGDPVLEVGCGTGQLTRALVARGLRITAVEPGGHLLDLARRNLGDEAPAEFINARLEDARLARAAFRAVFSASAFHWIDPDVGWERVAEALAPGGVLGLISYFGLSEERSADDEWALREAMARIAPDIAAEVPRYRALETILAGVEERRGNVSEVWSWLGAYDMTRESAAGLFEDVRVATVPILVEQTADELNALLGTMSVWSRLSSGQRDALVAEHEALYEQRGRPIQSSVVACLVTARRA